MAENKSILHELYVFSEWKPEPEYIQKPDSILPENISALWRWLKFFGPKKSLIDSITVHKEKQQKWHFALGDEGKVIAVLTDNILEIRTKRSDYATIAARTTVSRDAYPQWRKLVWSPDCSFLVLAYGNGVVSFFDLTASNLFNIPIDCSRPGGLECTDNTHAVADIIFMPLRVKDNKWNWEVLVVTYDGRLRGYVVSQTEGCKLHHTFRFAGGVSAVLYAAPHSTLYVAGLPRSGAKDPASPLTAGITAWRILNDDPFYKLSVVSDELEAQLANERFQLYIPFVSTKNLELVVQMALSSDASKLVCVQWSGAVSVWRLPLLVRLHHHPLVTQPHHALPSPLPATTATATTVATTTTAAPSPPADLSWWSDNEIIVSRFSGAVTVCNIEDMVNILGKKPEFFQGSPRVTCAYDGTFMVLECESNVLPAKKSRSDESMEVVKLESDSEDSMMETVRELIKSVLFAITDIETFQPRPRRITVVSRIYRLLGVKSTTPSELFSRKIESGNYNDALALAETFNLDSDLVYQQQWRKNPVSTEAIEKYLSKVSKKIWAVHQCVDRLPETLPAAKELLEFGIKLTDEKIINEINKERDENKLKTPDEITLEDLNAYTSELLRCRHVMLFYNERLRLYEAILKCEKSVYVKDEYDRLRSNSIVHSSMEIAKEGRIEALTCLWPNIKTVAMQLAVLEKLPETINPVDYQHLLPTKHPLQWFERKPPVKIKPSKYDNDWCRKEIFRSIWSSNWSEDTTPETETAEATNEDLAAWYDRRAREIESRSGMVSHALHLATLASVGGGVEGLDDLMFNLLTLDTLIYDINVEDVTLYQLEKMSILETCRVLMEMSTASTFVSDLKSFVIPFLKRYEKLSKRADACINGLTEYLESMSSDDLSCILLVLQSPNEFELDVRTHLELAERCLLAYNGTQDLDKACDLLDTILKESDGSISNSELLRRVRELEKLVAGCSVLAARDVLQPPSELRDVARDAASARRVLARIARGLCRRSEKPTQQDWADLLKDMLELQSTLFTNVSKEECYEIYASSLLTSGDAASIRLAVEVVTSGPGAAGRVSLVTAAAREYFNSADSLADPALDLARCCLTLIKEDNEEIEQELDLISALQILNEFGLSIIPIQVRLCEDRLTLIEDCLKVDPNAYMASHKLLKLAKLLRVAGDDEQTREMAVLQLVGEYAVRAGGGGAAADAARRLAALRPAAGLGAAGERGAALLARVAGSARAHADRAQRRHLLAAAAARAAPHQLEDVLRARLELELEGLQQMGAALKEHNRLKDDRWPSTDDEFSDAITTPVIEKKDLVAPPQTEKKPLLNYLLDTFQNKFPFSDKSDGVEDAESTEVSEDTDGVLRGVVVAEWYKSLHVRRAAGGARYRYDRFSAPEADARAPAALHWYYVQNCLDGGGTLHLETEVVQKCAEELVYKDTALSVACLLRAAGDHAAGAGGGERAGAGGGEGVGGGDGGGAGVAGGVSRMVARGAAAASAVLYAALLKCNAPELRDNVYLVKPSVMARTTLKHKSASEAQLAIIRQCIDKLSGTGDVEIVRRLGYTVNGLLFNADPDYRAETIYRLARSGDEEHLEAAMSLGARHELDALQIWLQHAAASPGLQRLHAAHAPRHLPRAHARIKEALWPLVAGHDHSTLLNLVSLLRSVDERPLIAGLTAADHIKLLKKAKAASPELDYKLLLEQPSPEQLSEHLLAILKPENIGMVCKFVRSLPPAIKLPLTVNAIYTMWLTKHFFNVPPANATNKKWMQQYRQCASYFNKLSPEDLLQFVNNTCFTRDAVERVPHGTRNLMIMQAVDYCQQEQENDLKFNKTEQSWSQTGQELTRWARFLDNFHSTTVQAIVDGNSGTPDAADMWAEVEMSHGAEEAAVAALARLATGGSLRSAALSSLLHCLHVPAAAGRVLHAALLAAHSPAEMETVISRICQYHKEGVKVPEEVVSAAAERARVLGVPAGRQVALLALGAAAPPAHAAHYTAHLLRAQCSDRHYAAALTEEKLLTEEGRRETFEKFLETSDTWQQKKALVDVLNCWPPTKNSESRSLHYVFLRSLLTDTSDCKESLVLIKLLLQRPVLTEEEVKWLADSAPADAVINAIWIVLLSKCEQLQTLAFNFILQHKNTIKQQDIEEDLIKELLDSGMFLKLVSTPLYAPLISYIVTQEATPGEPVSSTYTVEWATNELLKANYLAEVGHLRLMSIGVPSPLRGFSQSILYCKSMFSKN
ncbi:NBAS subunit of NRZ tethering complex-like [Achroia grisella]|uniref:NBAS subunit of NRZ tethering complex-like n=1 Tax=Achroia grisella TaxID=688607 RepID=UPI0027D247F7|nr:NBAS subunit of NRZ tethering complex-like [Achroia grisella]